MSDPLVALESVSRFYDGGRVKALRDVSLTILGGEFVAIVGPSGSGKSTLLHLACGLDRPTDGRVLFEGVEPGSIRQWTRLRAKRIGFIFQAFNLLPTLTARQNVEMPMFGVTPGAKTRRQKALNLLERVGLADRAGHRPSELSGGERQRVAVARSLANSPKLILADEPTGNLDSETAGSILHLFREVYTSEGKTVVLVTHNPNLAVKADRRVAARPCSPAAGRNPVPEPRARR